MVIVTKDSSLDPLCCSFLEALAKAPPFFCLLDQEINPHAFVPAAAALCSGEQTPADHTSVMMAPWMILPMSGITATVQATRASHHCRQDQQRYDHNGTNQNVRHRPFNKMQQHFINADNGLPAVGQDLGRADVKGRQHESNGKAQRQNLDDITQSKALSIRRCSRHKIWCWKSPA